MNTVENYHFTVGNLKCTAINDGTETVSVENIVKNVSTEEWNRTLLEHGYSPTEALVYYFNCLTIRTDQQRILIDAGWGRGTQRRDGVLLDRLQLEGIAPADIDLIVITHGDVDHIGGLTNAESQLVFPNAQYVLLKGAWDFWSNGAVVAKWPEFLTFFGRKTLPLIRGRLRVVEAGVEFLPGFQLLSAPGHRPGHTVLEITSSGEHLLHLADSVGHPILLEVPSWQWSADFKPEQAARDKSQLLDRAVAQQALLFGSHLPFPGVGHVAPQENGWRWQPAVQRER